MWLTPLLDTWDTSFYLLMPNVPNEWRLFIASISCNLLISLTAPVIAHRNGLWQCLHLSVSTVLSLSLFFLMFWYMQHIWPLPLSLFSDTYDKTMFWSMYSYSFSVSCLALFSSFSRRSKDVTVFPTFSTYLLTSTFTVLSTHVSNQHC